MIIALDGPAGAGKSTIAKAIAKTLGIQLIETGALYRAVGLIAREQAVALDEPAALARIADTLNIAFEFEHGQNRVLIDGIARNDALHTETAGQNASVVSSIPEVRQALLGLQRTLANAQDSVLEGRDIGTVVCPDATHKFFITASAEVRAKRRYEELQARGETTTFQKVLEDMRARDRRDTERTIAPLCAADDAFEIDTSYRTVEDILAQLLQMIRQTSPV